jgi:hypothetical protein
LRAPSAFHLGHLRHLLLLVFENRAQLLEECRSPALSDFALLRSMLRQRDED